MVLLDIAAIGLAAVGTVSLLQAALLLAEALAAMGAEKSQERRGGARRDLRPRVAVLVPAHDEERLIADTLRGIVSQIGPEDRLVVVADNCTDATAEVARAAGAEVVVRTDSARRGKSYALDFGVRHLALDPSDVLIVIDADCKLDPGSLETMAFRAHESGRPVQASNESLLPTDRPVSLGQRVAMFAVRVKNHVRSQGLKRMGLPCQLMGTGMAFPWPAIRKVEIASGELAEDLVLGLELARTGHAPSYCPAARVTSPFPLSAEGVKTQRERWETGHLRTIARRIPGFLVEAIRSRNVALLALAADAAVPPLALGALAIAANIVLSGGMALLTSLFVLPLVVSTLAAAVFALAIGLAWFQVGRDILSARDLALMAPAYALAKLPIYARALRGKRIRWIRSPRD